MDSQDNLLTVRFLLNMKRISGLIKLVMLDVDVLKPPGLFESSKGPRADVLRAIVVFLHATFEDFLRSMTPPYRGKWNFYSDVDIDKALRRRRLDPAPFKALYPPLTQMAKRRNRIVHSADLAKETDTAPGPWTVADDWQLVMWLLTVSAFHSQVRVSIEHEDQAMREKNGRLRGAMKGFVEFGKQLLVFSETPPELRLQALERTSVILSRVLSDLAPPALPNE
jgi:hypothetical protein